MLLYIANLLLIINNMSTNMNCPLITQVTDWEGESPEARNPVSSAVRNGLLTNHKSPKLRNQGAKYKGAEGMVAWEWGHDPSEGDDDRA